MANSPIGGFSSEPAMPPIRNSSALMGGILDAIEFAFLWPRLKLTVLLFNHCFVSLKFVL